MKSKLTIILIFLLGALASCTKDTVKPTVLSSTVKAISFSVDIQPTFTAKCIGCHDHAGDQLPDLTSGYSCSSLKSNGDIDTVTPANSILYKKLNTGGNMSSYPADATFAPKILQWITAGAKNN
jgi:hypothetical protein